MSLTPDQRFVCKRAAELLQRGTCKGAFARDAQGLGTSIYSPEAESFCLIGALQRARYEGHKGQEMIVRFVDLVPIVKILVGGSRRLDAMEWWDALPASGQLLAITKLAELGSEQTLPSPASPD